MGKLFRSASIFLLSGSLAAPVMGFELLSEGAMGTVSAISADSVEDIVNVAGPTAAGLTVDDDGYELLPFQSDIVIQDAKPEEVTDALEFVLTQEVETWASSLRAQEGGVPFDPVNDVGYVDELPPSAFEASNSLVRDEEFDSIIFDSDSDQENRTSFELGRIEQAVSDFEQNLGSIRFVVERKLERAATVVPDRLDEGQEPFTGSSYLTNLTSISNVRIATVRD